MEKYLFDLSFDKIPEPEIPVEEVEPVITYSEEEYAKASQESFDQGFAKGQQEALNSIEKQALDVLEHIKLNINSLDELEHSKREDYLLGSIAIGKSLATKIFPMMSKKYALEEVEGIIRFSINQLLKPVGMKIQVHPNLVEHLDKKLASLQPNKKYIFVVPDQTLALNDVKLIWNEGGLEHVTRDILHKTDQVLADYINQLDIKVKENNSNHSAAIPQTNPKPIENTHIKQETQQIQETLESSDQLEQTNATQPSTEA